MGIIPAYAGSTSMTMPLSSPCGDHPRVCGEHIDWKGRVVYLGGSSPRMRGAQTQVRVAVHPRGIIPAYAGSTPFRPPTDSRPRDHPRVCGEHHSRRESCRACAGSSPRMRGAP